MPGASPSVAADEVCTRRGTPACAAARTAATAPSTLTRRIGSGSSTQSALTPATWKASVGALHAARERVVVEHVAAHDLGAAALRAAAAAASERASATTSSPRATRRSTSAPPITPLPPVTKTRLTRSERSEAENFSR